VKLPQNYDWERRYNSGESIIDIAKKDGVLRLEVWLELKKLGLFQEQRIFNPKSVRCKDGRVSS
jgi:hypothetical protein